MHKLVSRLVINNKYIYIFEPNVEPHPNLIEKFEPEPNLMLAEPEPELKPCDLALKFHILQ